MQRRWDWHRSPDAPEQLAASIDLSAAAEHWQRLPCELNAAEQLIAGQLGCVSLLGKRFPLDADGTMNWRLGPVASERLETITLHYHEWFEPLAMLAASGDQEATAWLRRCWADWLRRCDLTIRGSRPLAWNAYAIATRLMTWPRCLCVLPDDFWTDDLPLQSVLDSLFRQAAFLRAHLEWDVRANHLLRDGVGLMLAGRLFRQSDWHRTGERIVVREIETQFHSDGTHYEQSLHYHAEVLADCIAARCAATDPQIASWTRLHEFVPPAYWQLHSDDAGHLFNDSTWTTKADLDRLADALEMQPSLERPTVALRTGLQCIRKGDWTVFFDCGSDGCREQPGHGHADALSVEVSVDGRRLIVDPGTFHYDNSDRRHIERNTAAHNTPVVIIQGKRGRSTSDVWHIFRMGRRAEVTLVQPFRSGVAIGAYRGQKGLGDIVREVRVESDELRIRDSHSRHTEVISGQSQAFLIPADWNASYVEKKNPKAGIRLQQGTTQLIATMHPLVDEGDPPIPYRVDLFEAGTDGAEYAPRYLELRPAHLISFVAWPKRTQYRGVEFVISRCGAKVD